MSLRQEKRVVVDGVVGKLEIKINKPPHVYAAKGCMVVAHPHPMHGGTMDNKVIHTLARASLAADHVALRFNFRGVGSSEGVFDNGIGETDDMVKVVEYAVDTLKYENIVLAGFSFGAVVAARVAMIKQCKGLILIAPAVDKYAIGEMSDNLLVVHGDQDDLVPLSSVLSWAEPQKIPITVFPGTGHFFHGMLLPLQNLVKRSLVALK